MANEPDEAPLAEVTFRYGLDDQLDVSARTARTDARVRRMQRRFAWNVAGFAGLFAFCLCLPLTSAARLAITAASFVLAVPIARWQFGVIARRQLRDTIVAEHGPGEHECLVGLYADGLSITQPGLEADWPWHSVLSLRVAGGDVELRSRRGLLVVRGRAFATPADRERFVAIARERIAAHAR